MSETGRSQTAPLYDVWEGRDGILVIASDDPTDLVVHVRPGGWSATRPTEESRSLAAQILDLLTADASEQTP